MIRRARSAVTGRFVKLAYALRHPRSTVVEKRGGYQPQATGPAPEKAPAKRAVSKAAKAKAHPKVKAKPKPKPAKPKK